VRGGRLEPPPGSSTAGAQAARPRERSFLEIAKRPDRSIMGPSLVRP